MSDIMKMLKRGGQNVMADKKRLTISLAEDVFQKLVEDAKKAGLNKSAYITILIKDLRERE